MRFPVFVRNPLIAVIFVVFTITLAPCAFSASYYVDAAGGSDSYNGLYQTYQGGSNGPWRTLGKANTAVASGASTIRVAAGAYSESVVETHSGTDANNFLHWLASGTVQINGSFEIQGNYVKLEGFTLRASGSSGNGTIHVSGDGCSVLSNRIDNSSRIGIKFADSSDRCLVSGNTIARSWLNGIEIHGTNQVIENNDISDQRCNNGGYTENDANGMVFFGSGHRVTGNYIHNITFAANPGYTPHIDGFQTFSPGASNCIFEKNRVDLLQSYTAANQSLCTWMLAQASYITIRNNISRNTVGVNTGGGGVSNLSVLNNTFLNDLGVNTANWPSGVGISNVSNCVVKNNIFYNHYYKAWEAGGSNPGLDVDYNNIYRAGGSYTETRMPHDVWAQDPQFVNAASDWSLRETSPCVGRGATLTAITSDYAGVERPQQLNYDIGAYELPFFFNLRVISIR